MFSLIAKPRLNTTSIVSRIAGGEPLADENNTVEFATVLADELNAIRHRRRAIGVDDASTCEDRFAKDQIDDSDSQTAHEHVVRREALDEDLVGICFSGGGIRSATFNLGILHGLADLGLLKRFDYLSTVSGGGYIGSWLSAWVKREGSVENVEKQLQSTRLKQATAERRGAEKGEVFDADPEPICHLRAFSNYLTPRLGVLSVDAWVLGSIYLRNLLLNLLVLVPFLLALVMSERVLILTFISTTDWQESELWERVVWLFGLTLYFAMLLVMFLWIHRSIMQIRQGAVPEHASKGYRRERRYLHRCVLIPCLILAILSTWLAYGHLHFDPDRYRQTFPFLRALFDQLPWLATNLFPYLLTGTVMGIVVGSFHLLLAFDDPPDIRADQFWKSIGLRVGRLGLGAMTGFAGGVILCLIFHQLHRRGPAFEHEALIALTFGPPLFLIGLNLIAWLQVGLISRQWPESIREWWASVTGSSLIYVCGWIVLFGLSIWGPWFVLKLEEEVHWIDQALLAGWSSIVGGGLLAIRNSASGADSVSGRLFLKVLPYIFLVGLIVLTSFVTDYFMLPVGKAASPEAYLQAVEQQNEYFRYMPWVVVGLLLFTAFASSRIDVNSFGMHALYRNRLVRCYLGASRRRASASDGGHETKGAPTNVTESHPRSPNALTGFDPYDDMPLSTLDVDCERSISRGRQKLKDQLQDLDQQTRALKSRSPLLRWWQLPKLHWKKSILERNLRELPSGRRHTGPYHIICTALNLVHGGELAWQERMAESFALTPKYCGSRSTRYARSDAYFGGVSIGEAVAISGAAVSPNMGYHSRGPMTALLAIFNMRLGAWLGNPRLKHWKSRGPRNLLKYFCYELFGLTNANEDYVYLSDGGHFENLGLYELLRRRCRFIVVSDSGADPEFSFQDLGGIIRKARIDFGITIEINVNALKPRDDDRTSPRHVAVGRIHYGDVDGKATDRPTTGSDVNEEGILVYVKPTITGDEPQDVLNYRTESPSFPHEPTTDQWFSESQFESYRALGWHVSRNVFGSAAKSMPSGTAKQQHRAFFQHLLEQWRSASPVPNADECEPSQHRAGP